MIMRYDQIPVGEILTELARRLRTERLNQNMTQKDLSDRAGVSVDTIRSIESGGNPTLAVLVKVLRGLALDDRLEMLIPSVDVSPIEVARREGQVRERATGTRAASGESDWQFANAPDSSPPVAP